MIQTAERAILYFFIPVILLGLLLNGCSTLTGPATNQQLMANTLIKYATIKAVESAKSPTQAAARARETLSDVTALLNGGDLATMTLDALDGKVKALIAAKHLDPADAMLFDTIRQAAHDDIASRIGTSGVLTPEQVAAIKVVVSDIFDGLTLSGY